MSWVLSNFASIFLFKHMVVDNNDQPTMQNVRTFIAQEWNIS